MRRLLICLALLCAALIVAAGCSKKTQDNPEVTEAKVEKPVVPAEEVSNIVTTPSGLKYEDLVVGEGQVADNGMNVVVHYSLWLDRDGQKGQKIQSSKDTNSPLPFRVGQQGLIKGWNEGMLGMKPGGTRRLFIPADLGYGAAGRPPIIPSNAALIFEIELLEIK